MSLYKLDKLAGQLNGKDLASARVKVFVEKAADGFAERGPAAGGRGLQDAVADR